MSRFSSSDGGLSKGAAWIFILATLWLSCPEGTQAGASGLNVLIVANQDSSNSLELASYYRVKRQIPPQNVLKISWPGNNVEWTRQDFTNTLLNPVLSFVQENQLTNQIQYVLLSMDLPYRITGTQDNSTTAALFYGYKAGTTNLDNSYAMSEQAFAVDKPDTAVTNSFLTMMLTADTLEEAKHVVDQGLTSDHTFPSKPAWLVKSSDPARNIRYKGFDNAIFNTRLCDNYTLMRTNLDGTIPWTNFLGCQLGVSTFSIVSNAFVPGSIADDFTSFGGKIFEDPGQTTLLEFIGAGASGSYGTVTEPLGVVAKFPDPMVYFYQARGFNLAECYYQSVSQPFQGLFVGEPLAAPWRRTFTGGWSAVTTNTVLQGTTNLCVSFLPDAAGRPVDHVDLFIDGRYFQTLTNIAPETGNLVTVRLNGYAMTYEVSTNATLEGIAAGLAEEVNKADNTNVTKVTANAVGDRIELQSFAEPLPAGIFEVIDDDGTTNTSYLAAPGAYSVDSSVAPGGLNGAGGFTVQFASAPGVSNVLEASTNLYDWLPVYSNAMGGAMEFLDTDALLHPLRFYRVAVPSPNVTPQLHALGVNASNQFVLQIDTLTNTPYVVQTSPDYDVWSDVSTNAVGDSAQFAETISTSQQVRYYRTRSAVSNDYAPMSVVGQTPTGGNILNVLDTALGDLVVWSSTNGTDWVPIYRYAGFSSIQTEVGSSSGAGEPLTTLLRAAEPAFLDSTAFGIEEFIVADFPADGLISVGAYLSLTVTKTNGSMVTVGLTNNVPGAAFTTFMQQFVTLVNTNVSLQEQDGLVLEDFIDGPFPSSKSFTLRARAPGQMAAQIQASLAGSPPVPSGFVITPSGNVALEGNLSDLLPRNHLYVSAGAPFLTHCFDLDTTGLSDGHHELTAVAYEGTHVNSQTLTTTSIIVSNTTLHATMALAEPGSVLPVTNQFDLVVTANTTDLQEILLFTTGGFYAGTTNQPAASFHVAGEDLGVGEHPFHALITTTNGLSYRTDKVEVTLTR